MARIPLLPTVRGESRDDAVDGSLLEAVQFGSRTVGRLWTEHLATDKRLDATLRAYELRARTRATPRGVFAGVQVARAARQAAQFRMGSAHQARSGLCAGWLAELAQQVIEAPGVLACLHFAANNQVVRRGDRFENEPASMGSPVRVTLRATPAVELILRICRTGATLDEIVTAVASAWADVPEQVVYDTVLEMVRQGFLLTDLLPDGAAEDPLGRVLSKLPENNDLAGQLATIRLHLDEADLHRLGTRERLAAMAAARDLCDTICRHENPITVDVAVDADIVVPTSLLTDAADAAGLLWAVTPTETTLESYHSRFVDRYGIGRRVPLRRVVDPVAGLGDPDMGTKTETEEMLRDRTRVLAGLITASVAAGGVEVVLDDATVAALRTGDDGVAPPPSGEIYVRVVASSQQDLDAGRYQLAAYFGSTQDAGSSIGRFASLLPGCVRDAGAECDSAVRAEIVVHPRLPKLDTVAAPTGFTQARICVGVAPRPGDLPVDDLEVASDGHRFVLWSASRDQEVVPALYSRIGPSYLPAVARLLQQLARSGTRPWHTWSWGPLSAALFQPRIRWRRTVLSPARWRLPHTLVAAADNAAEWGAELARWRNATTPPPPQVVIAEEIDRRIPLDLDDARDRDLLRRYVRRSTDTVTEQPGGPDAVQGVVAGPGGGHILELVIPLKGRQQHPAIRPRPVASTGPAIHMPGGKWLSLTITSPAIYHDDLLTHISKVAEVVRDDIDRWFWLRFDNTAHGQHLRVRFAGDPGTLVTRVLPVVSQRCTTLMEHGLVGTVAIEPYEPETVRYGGPAAIDAAERVFHTDSSLVLAALATRPDEDRRLLLAAFSAAEISRAVAGGNPAAVGSPRLDRPARRHVNALRGVAPAQSADLLDAAGKAEWRRRDLALTDYRESVPAARRAECASSVIHMHANRLGLSRDSERVARALAVQLLAKETRCRQV